MEVRPGYKQSEVGIIPDDWDVVPVSKLGEVKRGASSLCIKYRQSGGVRLIRINDFFEDKPVFVEPTAEIMRFALNDRDVLFAGTGASAGASYLPKNEWRGLPHSYNAPRIRVFKEQSKEFLLYSLQSGYLLRQQRAWFVGNAQPFLDTKAISNFSVALPATPTEQRAIAEALGDVDGLLVGLDRLITKKRDLKKAAMQQLLTGQTRLAGFRTEWKLTPLKQFVTSHRFAIVDGPFGSQLKVDEYVKSGVPVIEMEHLTDGVITQRPDRCVTPNKFNDLRRSAVYPGDILISKTGSLGKLGIMPDHIKRALITSRLAKISLNPRSADRHFVFQYLLKLRGEGYWGQVSQGGTMQILGIGMLQNVRVPNISVPEQTAIADVLTDMDVELAALEQRREKARDLKQAMMQELLTGNTRLL
jgi:type I restriction enzyme, S subunit